MNYIKQNHLSILIILFLVISPFFSAPATVASNPFGAAANVTTIGNPWLHTSTVGISGLVTLDGGSLNSYTLSTTTTATAETLAASDITNYSTVLLSPLTGATTLTLPASSTLSAFVPTAGDWAVQCWVNATTTTTTAGQITFAAGTGIDLENASSTVGAAMTSYNLKLVGQNSGCFRFIRKPATATAFDIIAQYTAFVDSD